MEHMSVLSVNRQLHYVHTGLRKMTYRLQPWVFSYLGLPRRKQKDPTHSVELGTSYSRDLELWRCRILTVESKNYLICLSPGHITKQQAQRSERTLASFLDSSVAEVGLELMGSDGGRCSFPGGFSTGEAVQWVSPIKSLLDLSLN